MPPLKENSNVRYDSVNNWQNNGNVYVVYNNNKVHLFVNKFKKLLF